MKKTSIEQLEEYVIRLNQSRQDGKILLGVITLEEVLKIIIQALKEK